MREDIKSMTLPELQGAMVSLGSARLPGRTDLYLAAPGGEVLPGDDQPVQGFAAAAGGAV